MVFNKVAATQSFSRAAEQLGVGRSTISRRISELERETGVCLFHRTARCTRLTAAGEALYTVSQGMDKIAEDAFHRLQIFAKQSAGQLRVLLPSRLGGFSAAEIVSRFLRRWPAVQVSASVNDCADAQIDESIDIAIRTAKRLPDSSLYARSFFSSPEILVAAPRYINNCGTPETLDRLGQHRTIGKERFNARWSLLSEGEEREVCLQHAVCSDRIAELLDLARLGSGVLRVPRFLVETDLAQGTLCRVCPGVTGTPDSRVFAVHREKQLSPNARHFLRGIRALLPGPREGDSGRLTGQRAVGGTLLTGAIET